MAALITVAAFVAATPYALLEWRTFLDGLQYQARHYSTGHSGQEGDAARWYLGYLWGTHGVAMLVAVGEALRALVTRQRTTALVAGFALGYLFFVSLFTVRNPWTIMPMIPLALTVAASGWGALARGLAVRVSSPSLKRGLPVLLALALLGAPAVNALSAITTAPDVDSRVLAAGWVADHLPAGSRIAVESYSAYADPEVYQVQGFVQFNTHAPEWYVEQGYAYLVFGKGMYGRFYADPERYPDEVAAYDALFAAFELVRAFPGGDYDVRIYATGASAQRPDAGVGPLVHEVAEQPAEHLP